MGYIADDGTAVTFRVDDCTLRLTRGERGHVSVNITSRRHPAFVDVTTFLSPEDAALLRDRLATSR